MKDVAEKHPSYWDASQDWKICRDNFDGQRAMVRGKNTPNIIGTKSNRSAYEGSYIRPTTGQRLDGLREGQEGLDRYIDYRDRALHCDFVADAVDMYLGISWTKPPEINLGVLEPLYGDGKPITRQGESVEQLYLRVNLEQWVPGRVGLLVDLPTTGSSDPIPYIAVYEAESIINWDSGSRDDLSKESLNLVVLDECGYFRDGLKWEKREQYRVLWLGDFDSNEAVGQYKVSVVQEDVEFNPNSFVSPTRGSSTLDEIPFVIINTKAVGSKVEKPPLLGLAYMSTDLYRLDADYKSALHQQGADTLVTKMLPEGDHPATGAGAHINIPDPAGDAKFIGVDSSGLSELREAVQNAKKLASKKAGELIADDSRDRESASALEQRIGTKTQTLAQLVMTAAEGMQKALRLIAKWRGATPEQIAEITVKPNLQFAPKDIDSAAFLAMSQAAEINPLLTLELMHEHLVKRGATSTTWAEMKVKMEENRKLKKDLMLEVEEGLRPRESGSTSGRNPPSASR